MSGAREWQRQIFPSCFLRHPAVPPDYIALSKQKHRVVGIKEKRPVVPQSSSLFNFYLFLFFFFFSPFCFVPCYSARDVKVWTIACVSLFCLYYSFSLVISMRKEPLMIELPLLSAFKKGRYEIQIWRWHTNELAAIILENIIFSHVLQTCRERESLLPCWRFRVEAPVSTGRQGDFPFWWNQIKRK